MFSAYFPGFLRVRKARKILGVFEVFLGIFKKTKEKKDRVGEITSGVEKLTRSSLNRVSKRDIYEPNLPICEAILSLKRPIPQRRKAACKTTRAE